MCTFRTHEPCVPTFPIYRNGRFYNQERVMRMEVYRLMTALTLLPPGPHHVYARCKVFDTSVASAIHALSAHRIDFDRHIAADCNRAAVNRHLNIIILLHRFNTGVIHLLNMPEITPRSNLLIFAFASKRHIQYSIDQHLIFKCIVTFQRDPFTIYCFQSATTLERIRPYRCGRQWNLNAR